MKPLFLTCAGLFFVGCLNAQQLIDSLKVPKPVIHKFYQWFPGATGVKWRALTNASGFEVTGKQRYPVNLLLDRKGAVLYLKTKFMGSDDSIFEVPAKALQRFDSIMPKAKDVIWTKGDDKTTEDTLSSHFHVDINGQPDDVPAPDITFDSSGNIYSYEYSSDFPYRKLPAKALGYLKDHYKKVDYKDSDEGTIYFMCNKIKSFYIPIDSGKYLVELTFDNAGNLLKETKKLKPRGRNIE